jgi:hypothetical protein
MDEVYWRRLALFATALAKVGARELAGGVAAEHRVLMEAGVDDAVALLSSDRQARLALEFSAADDVGLRLRGILSSVGPRLRREVLDRLPLYHRALVSDVEAPPSSPAPAAPLLTALADRLVREATR